MIMTMVHKTGEIRVIQGVLEVCSRKNLQDDEFSLHITLDDEVSVNKVPVQDLDRWMLVTDLGGQIIQIETKEIGNG